MSDELQVGDIVSFDSGPGLPRELRGKFFRIEAAGEPGTTQMWKLTRPYNDAECTIPYRAVKPTSARN